MMRSGRVICSAASHAVIERCAPVNAATGKMTNAYDEARAQKSGGRPRAVRSGPRNSKSAVTGSEKTTLTGRARCRVRPSARASPAPAACEANVCTAKERPILTERPRTLLTVDASDAGPRSSAPPCRPIKAQVIQSETRSRRLTHAKGNASFRHARSSRCGQVGDH